MCRKEQGAKSRDLGANGKDGAKSAYGWGGNGALG